MEAANRTNSDQTSIATAAMTKDGIIILNLGPRRRTDLSANRSLFTPRTTSNISDILKHLGGLKLGELADVFRTHQHDFLARWNSVLSRQQRKALRDIRDCRTAVPAGHLYECDRCGHRVRVFNSCRNRNCPKCQATARAKWLAGREAELLPVPYFHVVFTLPQQIGRLALQNPRQIYSILFQTASETLLTIAADPRHLGASIGFLAVLHTWGQNLNLHPHLHCVVR
jgi:hypothetical protein